MVEKDLCIGCGVCAAVCPQKAITMQYDENAFRIPIVKNNTCISCGLCMDKCPVLYSNTGETCNIGIYCGYCTQENKLIQSASGGFMTSLSEYIISEGGVVFGVCYNETFTRAEYRKAETVDKLAPMKGSKYIMSEIDSAIYYDVRHELQNGKKVLFTGCPCEIAALKSYLGRDNENLLTCDLICQGATTPLGLQMYLQAKECMMGSRIINLNMRAKKDKRWLPYHMYLCVQNGNELLIPLKDTDFDNAFQIIKRSSCYQCHFKLNNSMADLTAGDHLGCNEGDKCYHSGGVSVIFAHSEKGLKLLNSLKNFSIYPETYERAAGTQAYLEKSIKKSPLYDPFLNIMHQEGLTKAAEFVRQTHAAYFDKIIQSIKRTKNSLDVVIWGVGKYFEITYETIRRILPEVRIVAIVDKYKTGIRHEIEIIKPEMLDQIHFDYVFITTVNGKEEAVAKLERLIGETAAEHYILCQ